MRAGDDDHIKRLHELCVQARKLRDNAETLSRQLAKRLNASRKAHRPVAEGASHAKPSATKKR